jgi:aspartyl-tRNA(Asn)/glutamyl-tRNA(Gln) amidotransferase subunit C
MVTREEILKIVKLSRLSVEESEIEQLVSDMEEIIDFAGNINDDITDKDTEFEDVNKLVNVFHKDEVVESYHRDEILRNREGGKNGYFIIKKSNP